jgi:hypothetical protein
MRKHIVVFDKDSGTSRIAFRDPSDPPDMYYVMTGIPPINGSDTAKVVAEAFNLKERVEQ